MTTPFRVSVTADGAPDARQALSLRRRHGTAFAHVFHMARAMWKGAISFSLVHIPVTLKPASREGRLDLDLLDRKDFAPVGYQRINKSTGRVVPWEQIVKGYEYEKGEYVVLSDEDFRQANVKATQTIDIAEFVERDEIDPAYYEKPYYLLPDGKSEKVYALLRDALEKSKRVAIATIVLRTRQSLAALVPSNGLILLNTLRFADEIVDPDSASAQSAAAARTPASSKELQMAMKLIDEMSGKWKPETYHDTYRGDLMKRIEQKVKAGKTHTLTAPKKAGAAAAGGGKVVDLASLLSRSLEQARDEGKPTARRPRRTQRRTKRARTARRA